MSLNYPLGLRTLGTHGEPRALSSSAHPAQFMPCVKVPDRAFVFVHGYSGGALSTWSTFSTLLPQCEQYGDADIFFYEFDGIQSELYASIGLLRAFLIDLIDDSTIVSSSLDVARRQCLYKHVVLVGHSLGGVLIRGALIECIKKGKPWAPQVELVMYAPAHSGARIDRLAASAVKGFPLLPQAATAGRFKSPLVEQLAEGSKELEDLKSTVQLLLRQGHHNIVPTLIVTAENEHVVSNKPFIDKDPLAEPIRGSFHTTVCKPSTTFSLPLDLFKKTVL